MEFIWTLPLFILPVLIVVLFVKSITEYKTNRTFKLLKISFFVLTITVLFYFLIFSSSADTTKYYEQKLSGQFRMADSSEVILNLLPSHAFTLVNNIDNKYYGDGIWEIDFDAYILLTLDFENGETLTLKYLPKDSILVGDNELTEKIKFQKMSNND